METDILKVEQTGFVEELAKNVREIEEARKHQGFLSGHLDDWKDQA